MTDAQLSVNKYLRIQYLSKFISVKICAISYSINNYSVLSGSFFLVVVSLG